MGSTLFVGGTSCDRLSFIYSKWAVHYLSEELRVTVYLLFTANGQYIICRVTSCDKLSFIYSKRGIYYPLGCHLCDYHIFCLKQMGSTLFVGKVFLATKLLFTANGQLLRKT
jgi:hypothetical protein